MFKRLKEKKELEQKYGHNYVQKCNYEENVNDDNDGDDGDDGDDRNDRNDRNDYIKSNDTIDTNTINDDNHGDEKRDDSIVNECVLLRNEIIDLKNQISQLTTIKCDYESQTKQLINENKTLKHELKRYNDDNTHLNMQLREYQTIGHEKDELMFRNAQLSSEMEKMRRDLEEERYDRNELQEKLTQMTPPMRPSADPSSVNDELITRLNETIVKLEETIGDKNKTIKLQQQTLNDIRKTFQKDLNLHNTVKENDIIDETSQKNGENSGDSNNEHITGRNVNFTYLKNVMFKYMTSTEYEAIHLVKAIAVLLNFTNDEEKLVKETIEWKMSWFGTLMASKPSLTYKK